MRDHAIRRVQMTVPHALCYDVGMSEPKQPLNVRVSAENMAWLERRAAAEDRTKSQLIDRMLTAARGAVTERRGTTS